MKQFKKGDRVIITRPWKHTESMKYGEIGVVETAVTAGIKIVEGTTYLNDQVILEEVFNSPLYKAMRENDTEI